MIKELTAFTTDGQAAADGGTVTGESTEGGGSATGSIAISGSIRSREDVVRMLDRICDYYSQVEPSSPVPLLLKRAQKMVKMNFVETMAELSLATVDSLRPSMGSAVQPPA